LEDWGIDERMGSEWILQRFVGGGGIWSGFNCLRIGTNCRLLWMSW
jgi:hypothetical protein